MLIEWEAIRMDGDCIQTLANATRQLLDGEKECRKSGSSAGRNAILEWIRKIRDGRLLTNTKAYACMQRARIPVDAVRKSRLGKSRSKGVGRNDTWG